MMGEKISSVWPEWQVEGPPLGRGSYGIVYKAVRRDSHMESYSAIKVISIPQSEAEIDTLRSEGLSPRDTKSYLEEVVNDFVGEIRLMESFKGVQNIVSVEDYKVIERAEGIGWDIYIRMELLTPFVKYAAEHTLNEQDVIKLGVDICSALELCARRNVIHRDIKPENIFLNPFGDFKLGDFGIARKLENVTGGLSQKGTYNYMAPEVESGSSYDARVDLYSLGIVLYRLMNNNRLPFLDTHKQILSPAEREAAQRRRLSGEPLPPPCNASAQLAQIILRACAPRPEDRFPSAAAMKRALLSVNEAPAPAQDGDKTVSVRRASPVRDPNLTSSVRKAPPARESSAIPVDSFGEQKRFPFARVLALLLAAVLVIGGGIFAASLLRDRLGAKEDEADSDTEESADSRGSVYSDYDEEQIDDALAEASQLADNGDYAGALTRIKVALATYPKSDRLQEKEAEYTDALDGQMQQLKEQTLQQAEAMAAVGDYASAVALLQNAIDTYGEDPDYRSALDAYTLSLEQAGGLPLGELPPLSLSAYYGERSRLQRLSFSRAEASSELYDPNYGRFPAGRAIDGDRASSWQEGVEGYGVGESLTLRFAQTTQVSVIEIFPGFADSEYTFYVNSRPRSLRFTFSDGRSCTFEFEDKFSTQGHLLALSEPVLTDFIQITIEDTYDAAWQDTAISEVIAYR